MTDGLASILIPILCFTTLISLFLLYILICAFLSYRLVLHVQANAVAPSGEVKFNFETFMTGLRGFIAETEARAGFTPASKATGHGSEKSKVEFAEEDEVFDEKHGILGEENGSRWSDEKFKDFDWDNLLTEFKQRISGEETGVLGGTNGSEKADKQMSNDDWDSLLAGLKKRASGKQKET
jgi:hypothetical protein